jgi:hypothetical protein
MKLSELSESGSIRGYTKAALASSNTSDVVHFLSLLASVAILNGSQVIQHKRQVLFLVTCIWDGFTSDRTTVRRVAEWCWRCLIWTSANVREQMAILPDLVLNRLDCGIGIALIYAMRSSGSYKLWEVLRVLNTMLLHEREEVIRDGSRILFQLLQAGQRSTAGRGILNWKKVIAPMIFRISMFGGSKENVTVALKTSQKELLTITDVMPLYGHEIQGHWVELLQLFCLSIKAFSIRDQADHLASTSLLRVALGN